MRSYLAKQALAFQNYKPLQVVCLKEVWVYYYFFCISTINMVVSLKSSVFWLECDGAELLQLALDGIQSWSDDWG